MQKAWLYFFAKDTLQLAISSFVCIIGEGQLSGYEAFSLFPCHKTIRQQALWCSANGTKDGRLKFGRLDIGVREDSENLLGSLGHISPTEEYKGQVLDCRRQPLLLNLLCN